MKEFKRNIDSKKSLDVGNDSSALEEMKRIEFEDSLNKIISIMSKDPDLLYGYQSNIAMSFCDEYNRYRKKHKKEYLNRLDIHTISNKAAQTFLRLWTSIPNLPFKDI